MVEVKKGVYVIKSKIISLKIANKDAKWWVIFNCGKTNGEENAVFSDEFTSEQDAKAFLDACANSL